MVINFVKQAPIATGDYLGTPEGWNNNSPGFQPGVKMKNKIRFGGIFARKEQKS